MRKDELCRYWHPFTDEIELVVVDAQGNIVDVAELRYNLTKDGTGKIALILPPNVRITSNDVIPVKAQQSTVADELEKTPDFTIWIDGSCQGNPGPGGWAYFIEPSRKRMKCEGLSPPLKIVRCAGREPMKTTNNRMEMKAAIEALEMCKWISDKYVPWTIATVQIFSDSEYLVNIMKGKSSGSANQDLISALVKLKSFMSVTWEHARRNSCAELEFCDKWARCAATTKGFDWVNYHNQI